MKNYIYTALCIGLLLTSCEDYLDVSSPSSFDDAYVYSSEEETFRALTSIYNPITEIYGGRWITAFVPNTDVEFKDVSDTPSSKGDDFACFAPRSINTDVTSVMESFYKGINLANGVINGIENSELYAEADKTTPSNINQMYGEAKTLRALMYLELVRTWGDVPMLLKPSTSSDEMEVSPTDRDTILTTMINDLIAIEPTMMYAKDITYGVERASREFCQGLIALLSLTRGGWSLRPDLNDPTKVGTMKRPTDWKDYYPIAEKYAGKVITDGHHSLSMGFEKFWYEVCNLRTVNDDDFIFDIPLLKSSGTGEYCYYVGVPVDYSELNPYGKASGSYSLSPLYMLSFDKDDLRRDVTCVNYKYDGNLNQTGPTMGSNQLAGIKDGKYRRTWMETPLGASTTKSTGVNASFMRYADVLLMYAEAANENNNGPTEMAKEALKTVRRRAFKESLWSEKVDAYVDSKSDKESFFQAICNERKWEFGGENKRKYDLARWNIYGKVIYDMYFAAIAMGKSAQKLESNEYDNVPDYFYYKQIDDPDRAGKKKMDFLGLYERLASKPSGYSSKSFAASYWVQDKTTSQWGPCATLNRCFRGYFTSDNVGLIDPEVDPVPYFLPFGQTFLSNNKNLKNYYGFQ
jgi:hypothetical protein